ncbi:MAG: hypothetical protein KDA47_18530, partial [Planctomycetales bacterium]|nr:hypothetical protein [Planctomycetales bacterium]
MDRPGYINVDELQAQTTLEAAAAKCGVSLDARGGREVRIDCPFGCAGDHVGKREISINTENPQKVFLCHAYHCQFRVNLLTLMHGWVTGSRPTGDKLKGAEFARVKNLLAGKTPEARPKVASTAQAKPADSPTPSAHNVPLAESDNERVRELVDIDTKFKVEPAEMNPRAAAYVRQHPCLTPDMMRKWRVGYLPHDGGGDKRGWSLRGHIVYSILSEEGHVLSWVGRDPQYEQREQEFNALSPEVRREKSPPMRHRLA